MYSYRMLSSAITCSSAGVDFKVAALSVDNSRVKLALWVCPITLRLLSLSLSHLLNLKAVPDLRERAPPPPPAPVEGDFGCGCGCDVDRNAIPLDACRTRQVRSVSARSRRRTIAARRAPSSCTTSARATRSHASRTGCRSSRRSRRGPTSSLCSSATRRVLCRDSHVSPCHTHWSPAAR